MDTQIGEMVARYLKVDEYLGELNKEMEREFIEWKGVEWELERARKHFAQREALCVVRSLLIDRAEWCLSDG